MVWESFIFLIISNFAISSGSEALLSNKQTYFDGYERKITNEEHERNAAIFMNRNQWQCGSGSLSTWFAAKTNWCWDRTSEINMCCHVHDDCYMLSRGQKLCDNEFCGCLDRALEWRASSFLCSKIWNKAACTVVELVGHRAYGNSSIDEGIERHVPALNKTVEKHYKNLYDTCPQLRSTFSGCAYNHMICYMRLLPDRQLQTYEDCVDSLISCLDESSKILVPFNEVCLTPIAIVIKSIADDSKFSGIPTIRKAKGPKNGYKFIKDSDDDYDTDH